MPRLLRCAVVLVVAFASVRVASADPPAAFPAAPAAMQPGFGPGAIAGKPPSEVAIMAANGAPLDAIVQMTRSGHPEVLFEVLETIRQTQGHMPAASRALQEKAFQTFVENAKTLDKDAYSQLLQFAARGPAAGLGAPWAAQLVFERAAAGDRGALDVVTEGARQGTLSVDYVGAVLAQARTKLSPSDYEVLAWAAFNSRNDKNAALVALRTSIRELRPGALSAVEAFTPPKHRAIGDFDPDTMRKLAKDEALATQRNAYKEYGYFQPGFDRLVAEANAGDAKSLEALREIEDRGSSARIGVHSVLPDMTIESIYLNSYHFYLRDPKDPLGQDALKAAERKTLRPTYASENIENIRIRTEAITALGRIDGQYVNDDVTRVLGLLAKANSETDWVKRTAARSLAEVTRARQQYLDQTEAKKVGAKLTWDDADRVRIVEYGDGSRATFGYDGNKTDPSTLTQRLPGGTVVTWKKKEDEWVQVDAGGKPTGIKWQGSLDVSHGGIITSRNAGETRVDRLDKTRLITVKLEGGKTLERLESPDGNIVQSGLRGKPQYLLKWDGGKLVEIRTAAGEVWTRTNFGWKSNKDGFFDGDVVPTTLGLEWRGVRRDIEQDLSKSMSVRAQDGRGYPRPGVLEMFNNPTGPQLMEMIQESTFAFRSRDPKGGPDKVVEVRGRDMLSYKNKHLWPYMFFLPAPDGVKGVKGPNGEIGFPGTAVKGPMMGLMNKALYEAAQNDAKRMTNEMTGFIRNVEVSGEKYGLDKLDADETRTFPPDHATTKDGRTFTWNEVKTVSLAPYRTDSFVDGSVDTGKFTFNAASEKFLRSRYNGALLTGTIPRGTSFSQFVALHEKMERSKYKELFDDIDAIVTYRNDKGAPERMTEVLRKRKKGDPAFVVRNLHALIPGDPFIGNEKQQARRIWENATDIKQEIKRRLNMIDEQRFAELAAADRKIALDLSPIRKDVRSFKDYGAIPALNLPPDHPDYQAFWRGVLTPVNGMVSAFNYEDDLTAPVLPLMLLVATIAAPEIMVPAMIIWCGPETVANIGEGVGNYREGRREFEKAQAAGDKEGMRLATIKMNKSIEKVTAASVELALLVAPVVLPEVASLLKLGKTEEAALALRKALRAEGKTLNDIEFTFGRMREEIGKLPEGPGRQLAEQVYKNHLEMFDVLADIEGGAFKKSAFKAKGLKEVEVDGVKVKQLQFDDAVLPAKGPGGGLLPEGARVVPSTPGAPPTLKPGEILPGARGPPTGGGRGVGDPAPVPRDGAPRPTVDPALVKETGPALNYRELAGNPEALPKEYAALREEALKLRDGFRDAIGEADAMIRPKADSGDPVKFVMDENANYGAAMKRLNRAAKELGIEIRPSELGPIRVELKDGHVSWDQANQLIHASDNFGGWLDAAGGKKALGARMRPIEFYEPGAAEPFAVFDAAKGNYKGMNDARIRPAAYELYLNLGEELAHPVQFFPTKAAPGVNEWANLTLLSESLKGTVKRPLDWGDFGFGPRMNTHEVDWAAFVRDRNLPRSEGFNGRYGTRGQFEGEFNQSRGTQSRSIPADADAAVPRAPRAKGDAKSYFDLEGGWDKAKTNGLYPDMVEWTPADWYAKTLAKQVQERLAGAKPEIVKVPIDQVEFLHPIAPDFGGGVSLGKQLARQKAFETFLKENPGFRDITIDFQNGGATAASKSAGGAAKGFRTKDGRVILYDSNGRLFAYKRGISSSGLDTTGKPFVLEVEIIDWKSTPPGTQELILKAQEIRGGKGFDPVTGKVTTNIPREIPLDGKMVPLNEENAIQAYYRALAELQEAKAAKAAKGTTTKPSTTESASGGGGGAGNPARIPKPRSLSDIETRDWYKAQLKEIDARIAEMRAQEAPLEDIAREAHGLRNEAKLAARTLMADQAKAKGLPAPLTWEEALKKYNGDYEQIIGKSQTSNAAVDEAIEAARAKLPPGPCVKPQAPPN